MVFSAEKEHLLRITDQVHHFLTQQSLCDLSVLVQEQEFRLHRVIFAAVCPLLYNLITKVTQEEPFGYLTLKLHGLTSSEFQILLDYMYTGKTPNESQKTLRAAFIKVCCAFKIPFPSNTVWLTPRDDVHMAILPRNELGIIEVLLQQPAKNMGNFDKLSSLDDFLSCSNITCRPTENKDLSYQVNNASSTYSDNENKGFTDVNLTKSSSTHQENNVTDSVDASPVSDVEDSRDNLMPDAIVNEVPCDDVSLEEIVSSEANTNNNAQMYKKDSEMDTLYVNKSPKNEDSSLTFQQETSKVENFKCRKCQAVLHEISPPVDSSLVANRKEVRYHCKPCSKWYITLRGTGSLSPNILKNKKIVRKFLASVNGKATPIVVKFSPKKRRNEGVSGEVDDHTKQKVARMKNPEIKQKKPAPLKYKCDQCSLAFTRKNVLRQHVKVRHSTDGASKAPIESNENLYQPEKERPYICQICGQGYTRKEGLDRHERVFHGKVKQVFNCKVCDRAYASVKSFNIHCRISHPDDAVAKIPTPVTPLPKYQILIRESTPRKPEYSDLKIKTSPAAKTSRYKSEKKVVDWMPHEQESPHFECPFCMRKYIKHYAFQCHIAKCKVSIKFKCSVCPRRFSSKKAVQKHLCETHQFKESFGARRSKKNKDIS